jgi:hypothetical protein
MLYYMPHCGLDLYERVLSIHQEHGLSNMVLCGNSFQKIDSRTFTTDLQKHVPCLYRVLETCHEITIPSEFKWHYDIFNDTSFHYF